MNSYLSQQFLDEDYKSFCPRENGSHLFFKEVGKHTVYKVCLLYTSPSPRDGLLSRMPSSA